MSYEANQKIGALGVTIATLAVQKLGWIFREQNKDDHGIDAHIEVVNNSLPTGKLIGVQIKAGDSYFKDKINGEFIFRGKGDKLTYWSNHSLPVVILLVELKTETVFWQLLDPRIIRQTKAGWKIGVPESNILSLQSAHALEQISEGSPTQQRFQRLRLDLDLIRFLHKDSENRLYVEAETWGNKSLPRTGLKLICYNSDEDDEELIRDFGIRFGRRLEILLEHLFPWADTSIAEDYYEFYENEDTPRGYCEDGWRPYQDNGETALWRIELTVNALGQSFEEVWKYLNKK